MLAVLKHLSRNKQIYLLILLVLIIVAIPLSKAITCLGHDAYPHMMRIEGLAEGIEAGDIPPRIYYLAFDGYGYAWPLFYGDLFLYIPALWVVMGMNFYIAFKWFIIFLFFCAAISMYFCSLHIFKNKWAAFTAGLVFTFSSYFCTDSLYRTAIGEMQAFVFLPIAFLGLYSILFEDGGKWPLLAIGIACLCECHLLTTVMCVVVFALFALAKIKKFINEPRRLVKIGCAMLVFSLIAATFIFPLIEQLRSTEFLGTDGTLEGTLGTLKERSLTFPQLFSDFNYLNYERIRTRNFPNEKEWWAPKPGWVPNGVGFALVVILAIRLIILVVRFIKTKKLKFEKLDDYLISAFLTLFFVSNLFPWDFFQNAFKIIQFPWRMFMFSAFFIALAAGKLTSQLKPSVLSTGVVALVCGLSMNTFLFAYIPRLVTLLSYDIEYIVNKCHEDEQRPMKKIGQGEYLPTDTSVLELRSRGEKVTASNSGVVYGFSRNHGDITITFSHNTGESTYFELPLVMYKGYRAVLQTGNGDIPLTVTYGTNNVVRVFVDGYESGTVYVTYAGTMVQHVSLTVSIVSIAGLIAYLTMISRWKKALAPS